MGDLLPQIATDLCKKKVSLIDSKTANSIRQGKLGKRVYDERNCINCYEEAQKICYADIGKNPFSNDLHLGLIPEKFKHIINT